MKTIHIAALAATISLAACMGSSGAGTVQSIGKDSYTVRILSDKSISDAKQKALSSANGYCSKSAKRTSNWCKNFRAPKKTAASLYDITFYCLPQGDADFQRYRPQSVEAPAAE